MKTTHPLCIDRPYYLREMSELLTLVVQSYEALNIGRIRAMSELRFAIEHVEDIKKQALEKKHPKDVESLGLAASLNHNEEIDTFERMISFFHKKKPGNEIPWNDFVVKSGYILVNERRDGAPSR